MYADRYERAKPNPVSLTAAIGVNAALVAALLFSAPEIIETFDPPMTVYPVRGDPPPPPKPEPEKALERKAVTRDPAVVTPIPEVPPLPTDPAVTGTPDLPPVDLGQPSTGGGGVTVDPPKPAPVLVDAAPDARAEFQPAYPPSERRAGIEGAVTVRVLIGVDGRVKAVEAVRSVGDAFFAATRRQALARWRFRPATRDGIPYESWRTMTVRFVLEE